MKNLFLIVSIALLYAGTSFGQKSSLKSSHFTSPVPDSAELVHVTGDILFGEGPLWHPDGYLLFSDMDADLIYKMDPKTGIKEVYLSPSGAANGLAFDPQGRVIMCREQERDLARIEFDGTVTVLASHYDGKRLNSPNDLVIRSDGTVFFTDPYINGSSPTPKELGFNGVFAWTPDGRIILLDTSVGGPNGITLSPDQKNLYVNNGWTKTVFLFDIMDDNSITNKRVFAETPTISGVLDGMKVDENGFLYVAATYDGVWIFSPEGEFVDTINIPGITTNLNWGDDDYQTLYFAELNNIYKLQLESKGIVTPVRDPVYPINSTLKANYVSPDNDQVIFQTQFMNPDQLNFNAQAFITGMDIDFIDSIPLFDDGMHYDSNPGDGVFGNIYPGIPSENLFSLAVKTTIENPFDSFWSFESRLTTIGPLVINGLINMERDTVPDPGDSFLMKIDIKNKGKTATAKNVSAIIMSLDTTKARLSTEEFIFDEIAPGESAWNDIEEILYIDPTCPVNTVLDFSIDIMIEDYVYWRDTFQVEVGKGFISGIKDIPMNNEPDITIFPNPTSGIINISGLKEPAEIKLFTLDGKMVKDINMVESKIDLSDLFPGIYLIQLKSAKAFKISKIIIK
jgi:gluconolactonase